MADFEFRRVHAGDFSFCWPIYSEAIAPLTSGWNEPVQRGIVEQALADEGASILVTDFSDVGWLHVAETRFDIHLGHLYLEPGRRNRGLGTRFLTWMGERARRKDKDFTLDVPTSSPSRALYERLGFKAVRTSGGRVKMLLGDG